MKTNFINSTMRENINAIREVHVEDIKGLLRTKFNYVDMNSTENTNSDILFILSNELIRRKDMEIERLQNLYKRKADLELNREYYTSLRNQVNIKTSYPQHTDLGRINFILLGSDLLNEIIHAGYPYNGGEHTLYLQDTKENIEIWLEIVRDELSDKVSNEVINAWILNIKNKVH